ncbi:MAG: dihydrofolate reductase family protein [Acidimicrobiales bacterium]
MRKLVVGEFVSLDGVVQAPGAPDEDTDGGFGHGGWTVPLFNEEIGQAMTDVIGRAGALLLGRRTYDIFAASWPLVGDDDPIAATLNRIPKYVASRTLTSAAWNNSTILTGDVAEGVAKLKDQPGGEIQVAGSSQLIQTLMSHDLVDEYRLLVFPVLLGSGKRLFAEGTIPSGLALLESTTSSTGVVMSTYERRGEVAYGAVGPEQEPA